MDADNDGCNGFLGFFNILRKSLVYCSTIQLLTLAVSSVSACHAIKSIMLSPWWWCWKGPLFILHKGLFFKHVEVDCGATTHFRVKLHHKRDFHPKKLFSSHPHPTIMSLLRWNWSCPLLPSLFNFHPLPKKMLYRKCSDQHLLP